jgi:hypothetical protein
MSGVKRGSFVVRLVEDSRGEVSGVIQQVATGAKEAFTGLEAIGRVIGQMLARSGTSSSGTPARAEKPSRDHGRYRESRPGRRVWCRGPAQAAGVSDPPRRRPPRAPPVRRLPSEQRRGDPLPEQDCQLLQGPSSQRPWRGGSGRYSALLRAIESGRQEDFKDSPRTGPTPDESASRARVRSGGTRLPPPVDAPGPDHRRRRRGSGVGRAVLDGPGSRRPLPRLRGRVPSSRQPRRISPPSPTSAAPRRAVA